MIRYTINANQSKIIPILWTGKENNFLYHIKLVEKGANVTLLILLLSKKSNNLSIRTNIIHDAPETKSKVIVKGVLFKSTNIDFEGTTIIKKGSIKSNAWLSANILLLSKKSKAKIVPNLEIMENNVMVGHASSVGKINDNDIFYLMSRGLNRIISEKLIVRGFAENFLKEFPINDSIIAKRKLKWI